MDKVSLGSSSKLSANETAILEFCAWFHDIGRIDDSSDPGHGLESILDRVRINDFDPAYLRISNSHKLITFSEELYRNHIVSLPEIEQSMLGWMDENSGRPTE